MRNRQVAKEVHSFMACRILAWFMKSSAVVWAVVWVVGTLRAL